MRRATVVVVGAGHSGLAMSRCLTERSVDHVVLERGAVAQAWRSRRASLRLLTPTWMTRLPGLAHAGDDPDDYRAAMVRDQRCIIRITPEYAGPNVGG